MSIGAQILPQHIHQISHLFYSNSQENISNDFKHTAIPLFNQIMYQLNKNKEQIHSKIDTFPHHELSV
jgi:hypothetical protein